MDPLSPAPVDEASTPPEESEDGLEVSGPDLSPCLDFSPALTVPADANATVPPPVLVPVRTGPRMVHRLRSCCCCCLPSSSAAANGSSVPSTNQILPVTLAPSEWDFLEIRTHRRIRVIHKFTYPRREASTQSRQGGKFKLHDARDPGDTDSSDEEDYWFENAAPKRLQIQQPPPSRAHLTQNRIFNKFEPQTPPRIAGIQPPRKSSVTSVTSNQSGASSTDTSPAQRLPRKVIVATEGLDLDDEEGMVEDSPRKEPDADENGEGSEKDDRFVASALEDMSGMLLTITADSTSTPVMARAASDAEKSASAASPREERGASPGGSGNSSPHLETTSPKIDKHVQSEPDPEEERKDDQATVIVTGGHLGGMANVAFEGEEDEEEKQSDPTGEGNPSQAETESSEDAAKPEPDETDRHSQLSQEENESDAAYTRNRDLSVAIDKAQEEIQPLPTVSFSPNPSQSAQYVEDPNALPTPLRPALFLIHGVGGSASTWTSQIDFFSELGFEIIVPDLLGHGFSSVPDNAKCYTFSKLFRDLLTIFDHYIPENRQCVIIAHSYGCSFAAALTRTRPSNVIMLLLLASGGPTPLSPPKVFKSIPTSLLTCLKPFLRCGFLRQQQYNPRGRSMKFQEAFDVPSYVFRHIMTGQHWPEGNYLEFKFCILNKCNIFRH